MKNPLPLSLIVVALLFADTGTSFAQNVKLTIRFIPPVSRGIEAKCEAVTSVPILKVRTGTKIRWKIEQDDDNPCEAFNADDVKLQFPSSGIVNDDKNSKPNEYVVGHKHAIGKNGNGEGTVTAIVLDKMPYKYLVLLDGKLAQDPELEVSGTSDTKVKQ